MSEISGRIRAGHGGEDIRQAIERAHPTYSYDDMLRMAGEPDENGWRTVTIDVKKGETAVNPASTKRVLYGPLRVRYDIFPEGIDTTILDD